MKLIKQNTFLNQQDDFESGTLFKIVALLFCLLANPFAQAETSSQLQSLEEIHQTAKIFLEEKQSSADKSNIKIEIGKIDPRMRLKQCDSTIEAFFPQRGRTTGKTTVGVRCTGSVAWKLFIPVNIQKYQRVWVAKRNIGKNEMITKQDVVSKSISITNIRKTLITDINLIINTSAKRSIRAGSVIHPGSICLVCKGDKVQVTAKNDFLSIFVDGIALNDAGLGDTAQIKNSKSKRIFAALVTGKNKLSVHLSGSR